MNNKTPRDTISRRLQASDPKLRWLIGISLLAIVLISGATWLAVYATRADHQQQATIATHNLSLVLEQSIASVFDKVDLTLKTIALDVKKQYARDSMDGPALSDMLAQYQALIPELESLRMTDATGTVRYGAGVPSVTPVSLADRDFFIRLRNDANAGLVVSGPVLARISQKWVIVLARRLNRPDGSLAGIVYANIAVASFQRLFSDVKLGSHGAISLRTTALNLVTRYPDPSGTAGAIGSHTVSSQLRTALEAEPAAGEFTATTTPDGVERANSYRRFASYPFYILVGLATEDYLAAWRDDALVIAALATLAMLLTLTAAVLVQRSWQRKANASDALKRQSYRYQLLLRTASDGIHVLDADGRVLEVSNSFCALLGYQRDELLNMHITQWEAQWSASELHELLGRIAAAECLSVFETRHRRQDGRIVDVEINATGVELDGQRVLYASARDITQRKQAESALRDSEYQLRRVIDGSDQGFWDWNLISNAFTISARYETMLGYAPGEMDLSVDNWHRYVEADDLAKAQASIARHLAGESAAHELELRCRTKSGQWLWVLTCGRIVERTADGRPSRMSGTHTDISERKRNEAALHVAMAEAELANHAKSHFLAAASHDLRQPLSALSLYVGVLKRQIEPDHIGLVGNIQDCVGSLSELLTDLLDVSKLEAGVVTPRPEDFALDTLIATVLSIHAGEAQLKGLQLRSRAPALLAHTDPLLLRRIVGNLVANAIRYTERGGVLVACRRHQGKWWIEVWDTGIGIPQDKTEFVFEPFRQLDRDAGGRGSGLGLAIVAKTAQLLGLDIRLHSRLGRGSMFAVELPPGRHVAQEAIETPAAGNKPLRIGLVDDNSIFLTALVIALESAGHQVVAAATSQALLQCLGKNRPDILLSDHHLADGETGFAVIEATRNVFGGDLPALLITGDTDPALGRSMAERGIAVHYKPLQIETLLAIIGEATARRPP